MLAFVLQIEIRRGRSSVWFLFVIQTVTFLIWFLSGSLPFLLSRKHERVFLLDSIHSLRRFGRQASRFESNSLWFDYPRFRFPISLSLSLSHFLMPLPSQKRPLILRFKMQLQIRHLGDFLLARPEQARNASLFQILSWSVKLYLHFLFDKHDLSSDTTSNLSWSTRPTSIKRKKLFP